MDLIFLIFRFSEESFVFEMLDKSIGILGGHIYNSH